MAGLPYMTYSSVQCDGSQNTQRQSWQLSLIQPSVDLDTDGVIMGSMCTQCMVITFTLISRVVVGQNTDRGCYILHMWPFYMWINESVIILRWLYLPARFSLTSSVRVYFLFTVTCIFTIYLFYPFSLPRLLNKTQTVALLMLYLASAEY